MNKSLKLPADLGKEKVIEEKITYTSKSVRKTSQQIISRHINDKNDIITEEDFKNLDIEQEIIKE